MSGLGSRQRDRARAIRTLLQKDLERARPDIKADINVTPLVDVVLVLLIIFMVVTPLIASGVAVDLPRTVHHGRKPDDGKDIIISVTQDKRLYVGTKHIRRAEDLGRVVVAEKARFPEKSIFVKADARVPYGVVRETLDVLHEAEIDDVALGTEELTEKR